MPEEIPMPDSKVQHARPTAEEQLAAIMQGCSMPPVANFTYIHDCGNYGQRLQTYALQRYFRDEFGRTLVTLIVDPGHAGVNVDDGWYFHTFERECLNIVDARGASPGFIRRFSHVVLGGDQCFKTEWHHTTTMLAAVSQFDITTRNVFSYGAGASPANRHLACGLFTRLTPYVIAHGFREDYRVDPGMDAVKVIDPVFLIHDRWQDVERNAKYSGGTFKYTVRGGLRELVRTAGDGTRVFGVRRTFTPPDPRDFLGLMRGADTVVTNSYHGLCLALIYRIPRIELLSDDHRIRNVLRMLHVRIEDGVVANYDEVAERIAAEVARSRAFIGRCLAARPVDYCCHSADKSVRDASSSGGALFELARSVFQRGGVVYGGAFSPDFKRVVPEMATSVGEYAGRLAKSKYSFCPLPNIDELRAELGKGHEVVYVGSPCHVSALKRILGHTPDNLICVDFRCRGYSRPDKLSKFVDDVQAKTGKRISAVDFRPRHGFNVRVTLDDGSALEYRRNDFFGDAMPMCKRCPFVHGCLSDADLTFGDFWLNRLNSRGYGDDFTPARGCSLVSVNSARGAELWRGIADRLVARPVLDRVASMSVTLEDFFSHSFVISIDDARLAEFYSVFREYFPGCKVMPRVFRGVKHAKLSGVDSGLASHAAVVRMAKSLGFPFVAVFEDDAYPCIGAEGIFRRLLSRIPDPDGLCGIIQFGWIYRRGGTLTGVGGWESGDVSGPQYRILRGGDCCGLHSYVVPSRLYDRYITSMDSGSHWSLLRRFGGAYLTLDSPVFIQHVRGESLHTGVGYVYDRFGHATPPPGFAPRAITQAK